jgi:DNA-binding NarL/FixJ family response regulator
MLGPLLTTLMRQRKQEDAALERILRLTQREKEVLALLAEGADNEAIARALVISPQTARTHIQNILGKLNVHSRLEAAAIAMQNGLLENGILTNGSARR